MLNTSKTPRQPNQQEQRLDDFTCSVRRADHFYSTLDKKVYVLDGYGNLITVARTASSDSKGNNSSRLSITTAFVHNKRSRTEQIEDRVYLSASKELEDLYDVRGDAGVVLSQSVDFTIEELSTYEIVRDVNSNYCISLDRNALVRYSERRGAQEDKPQTVKNMNKSSLALNLTIVDNRREAPESYYVNVAGRVFCVPVVTSPDVEDGVWIDSNLKQSGMPMVEFQTLENSIYRENRDIIPSVTLFATALEAKRFGDADAELKELARHQEREILDLKHDLELTKAESSKAKAEQEDKAISRKDHYDEASYQRKDISEERSTKRKDDSEKIGIVTKTITAIVALAGAVVGLVRWLG